MKSAGPVELVILSAARTPFGAFGGALKALSATELGVHAARAALAAARVDPAQVGHVIFGNVLQTSPDAIYLARHVGLRAGVPEAVPALTVNRLCGSGFEAIIQAAMFILTGQAQVVLAGGTESMSQAPLVMRQARWGFPFGKPPPLEDSLWSALTDSYVGLPMALTAEQLAVDHGLTQGQVDKFAVLSQQRWGAAQAAGRFAAELAPLVLESKKGPLRFDRDESPRPETTLEGLARLPKVFKKDGVIHAGAASGIADGAAAMLVASRSWAERQGVTPLARLVNWGHAGVEPARMGLGPVPAVQNALARAEAQLGDFDLFEVNEAFAPQYLAVERLLGLPRDLTNVDGGAIALGHPLGASGARITAHLCHELKRRGGRAAIGSACIGGGQGVALILGAP
jgi:acetyl-CoA C-acetyltransferase/acetyl-CoA acyltransferase 2